MKAENKQKIEEIIHEIVFGSRKSKIKTILYYSGDEFESNDDFIQLATEKEIQLNSRLNDIIKYFLNEN